MAQHLILRRFGRSEEAARLVELFTKLYSRGSPLDEYRHLPGIARIVNPGNDRYEVIDFSLAEASARGTYPPPLPIHGLRSK